MHNYISGIQQIGVGVSDASASMLEYKRMFGLDTLIFDDVAEASLMTRYTGGELHRRRAVLSMNLSGGGGFEIWQFLTRSPTEHEALPSYGAPGIFAAKIKCADIDKAHRFLNQQNNMVVSEIKSSPFGEKHFWATDGQNNTFNIVKGRHWFQDGSRPTGGVAGAVIGVSNIDKALKLYRDVLGISQILYDESGDFSDTPQNDGKKYRRVLLYKPYSGKGAFGKLLGSVEIELVEALDGDTAQHIYNNRYWGDKGFIHLCLDVLNMDALKKLSEENGFNFTVDSNDTFDMENAGGRFCYVEDTDGTLIELVETHKVPVMKKLGLYINLKKRNMEKTLPDWMIKLLALSKVK